LQRGENMKIAIGCDEAAFELKEIIKEYVATKGIEMVDFGTHNDSEKVLYPNIAEAVSQSVSDGNQDYGILICGTGIGMAISANKVPGIRAAVCHDAFSTERSKKSNDCNVLCMGSRVIGHETAKYMVDLWLRCDFSGGSSKPKVDAMIEMDKKYRT
jgi:ribose 5-phosphate isomerase B